MEINQKLQSFARNLVTSSVKSIPQFELIWIHLILTRQVADTTSSWMERRQA